MRQTLLTLGQMVAAQARLRPQALGARDLERSMTFSQWNARSCRLANALIGLGLQKGDRVAVLAYNCVEWAEIYVAAAKAGLIAVPVNFRLSAPEVGYCIEDSGAAAVIAQDGLHRLVEAVRDGVEVSAGNFILFGAGVPQAGWRGYEDLLAARDGEPGGRVLASDPWTLMYTSGATGKPKGVIRTHEANALLALMTDIELGVHREDDALLVMPMCHANSVNFFAAFAYCGVATSIYSRASFDSAHCLRVLGASGATFTSLAPTHYIMA